MTRSKRREALAVLHAAAQEDREPTEGEKSYVGNLMTDARSLDEVDRLAKQLGASQSVGFDGVGSGPGDMFISCEQYKSIQDPASRPRQWTTIPSGPDTL
jgi:hypothetical protein